MVNELRVAWSQIAAKTPAEAMNNRPVVVVNIAG
jgi:hypothetical protein